MGYNGQKIAKANRLKAVGAREVGKFWIWRKDDVVIFIIFAIFFLLLVLALSIAFSPTTSLPRQEQQQQKRQLEPLVHPLLFHGFKLTPRPLPPSERQKRKSAMIPIHWSDHHGGHHGHHGHYGGQHYYYDPYYSYPMRPWGYGGGYDGYSSYHFAVPRERGVDRGLPYFELNERGLRYGRQPSRSCR